MNVMNEWKHIFINHGQSLSSPVVSAIRRYPSWNRMDPNAMSISEKFLNRTEKKEGSERCRILGTKTWSSAEVTPDRVLRFRPSKIVSILTYLTG
jgi:hypothetical protein